MRSYGVAETIDRTEVSSGDAGRRAYPDGIDVLIDLVSDAGAFASLVRPGGTAVTTQYVADLAALSTSGIRAVNFALCETSEVLETVAAALVDGRIVGPPITHITLDEVPAALRAGSNSHTSGKTVVVL
jgi:hypothetical protein